MDATTKDVTSYILHKLDLIRESQIRGEVAIAEVIDLLKVPPVAAPVMTTTESPASLLSRLKSWLPLLQQLGTMATKHAAMMTIMNYVWNGGNALTAAEALLKLL